MGKRAAGSAWTCVRQGAEGTRGLQALGPGVGRRRAGPGGPSACGPCGAARSLSSCREASCSWVPSGCTPGSSAGAPAAAQRSRLTLRPAPRLLKHGPSGREPLSSPAGLPPVGGEE